MTKLTDEQRALITADVLDAVRALVSRRMRPYWRWIDDPYTLFDETVAEANLVVVRAARRYRPGATPFLNFALSQVWHVSTRALWNDLKRGFIGIADGDRPHALVSLGAVPVDQVDRPEDAPPPGQDFETHDFVRGVCRTLPDDERELVVALYLTTEGVHRSQYREASLNTLAVRRGFGARKRKSLSATMTRALERIRTVVTREFAAPSEVRPHPTVRTIRTAHHL